MLGRALFVRSYKNEGTMCHVMCLQYRYHDGYIVRSHVLCEKDQIRHYSRAYPTLNPHSDCAGISCSVKTITLVLASTLYASSGKKCSSYLNVKF